jgi:hypothetical protein
MAVTATVQFLKRLPLYDGEKPFRVYYEIPKSSADQRRTNLEFEDREVAFEDIRCNAPVDSNAPVGSNYTLDDQGFAIRNFQSVIPEQDFSDRTVVEKKFLPQVEQLLRSEIPEITAIYVFDWRLRSADTACSDGGVTMVDLNEPTCVVRPAVQVHVDQSPRAVLHRIQVHCENVDRLLQGRVRVVK